MLPPGGAREHEIFVLQISKDFDHLEKLYLTNLFNKWSALSQAPELSAKHMIHAHWHRLPLGMFNQLARTIKSLE